MAVTHTWIVEELIQKNDDSGIVCCVKFKVSSVDTVNDLTVISGDKVDLADPAPEEMIPYSSLDESTVLTWIADNLGYPASNFEVANQAQIDLFLSQPPSPTKVEPLPW